MINRKGQVTIFVIMGIVLVVIIIGALFFIKISRLGQDEAAKREAYKGQDFSDYIEYYVKTCMEDYSKKTAYMLVETSFVNVTREKSVLSGLKRIPLLVDGETSNLMTLEESQNYYESLFNTFIQECVYRMQEESQSDFIITLGTPFSQVEFNEQIVLINITYPISASNDKQTIKKESFSYALYYDLKSKHELLNTISEKQLTTPGYFQIGFTSEEIHKRQLPYKISYESGPSKVTIIYMEDKAREMEFMIR